MVWNVQIDGTVYTASSLEELQQWCEQGKVRRHHKVQRPGTGSWRLAAEIPELKLAEKSQGLKTPAIILLGIYLVLVVIKVVADGAMPVSERVGYVTGAMITPAIFYWILALPIRLIRKRWPTDPNPLLLVIIALLVITQAAQFLTGPAMQSQRSAALQQELDGLLETSQPQPERASMNPAAVRSVLSSRTGDDLVEAVKFGNRWYRTATEETNRWLTTGGAISLDGLSDPAVLLDRNGLSSLRLSVHEYRRLLGMYETNMIRINRESIAEARSLPFRDQDFRKGFLTSAEENHRTTMDLNAEFFAIEKEFAAVALELIDFMDARHGTVGWDEVMVFETDEDVATYESLWSEIDRIAASETDVLQRMQQAEERRVAAVENLKEAVR